jgi:hypothetical protein
MKVKFKVKTKKQQIEFLKTIRGSPPENALSIHTSDSASQSRDSVPLNASCSLQRIRIKFPASSFFRVAPQPQKVCFQTAMTRCRGPT